MSTFLSGGAVCGPTSVLKNVGSRLDRDNSLQQDRLVSIPNAAGPSRLAARPQPVAGSSSAPASRAQALQPSHPFDLSPLRDQLASPAPGFVSQPAIRPHAPSGWADAFAASVPRHSSPAPAQFAQQSGRSQWQAEFHQTSDRATPRPVPGVQAQPPPWQRAATQPAFLPQSYYTSMAPTGYLGAPINSPAGPQVYNPPPVAVRTEPIQREQPQADRTAERPQPLNEPQDSLARTARTMLDEASSSDLLQKNPKLAQSKFFALMQGLSQGDVVVQEDNQQTSNGDEVGQGATFVTTGKGKAINWAGDFLDLEPARASTQEPSTSTTRAYPAPQIIPAAGAPMAWDRQFQDQEALLMTDAGPHTMQRRKSVHFSDEGERVEALGPGVPNSLEEALAHSATSIPGMTSSWEDPGLDLEDFDEEAFMNFNGQVNVNRGVTEAQAQMAHRVGYAGIEEDVDLSATSRTGRPARGMGRGADQDRYLFHAGNPYVADSRRMEREFSPTVKGVLELEAEVQSDPTNHLAWFALGLAQQENEREDAAILALSKVVELNPAYRPAYLALAVSYTNEGSLAAACLMMSKWIDLGEGKQVTPGWEIEADGLRPKDASAQEYTGRLAEMEALQQQRAVLVDRLINVARMSPDEVDPDTQVALGVLFNSSNEYEKAEDCFGAALSVRPDDWLLYNRLGATLANSGRPNEAIQYYHRALELHPNFVRALFNLGISYINLGQYPIAAQRVLEALRLQQADVTQGYAASASTTVGRPKGIGSDTLWATLRNACLHMGRSDLVSLANKKDINGFPSDILASMQATASQPQA